MAIGATLSLAALQSTFVTPFNGDAFGYWNNNRQLVVNATNQWVAVGGTVTFRSASCIRIAPWSIPYDAGTTALLDDRMAAFLSPCLVIMHTNCALPCVVLRSLRYRYRYLLCCARQICVRRV